ncbi:MAG: AzlD domain-containing protein [Beijerinckiaceae bacterium]|nr:AzlD domain-containing protein [Beijerinckiaceae bacterium]
MTFEFAGDLAPYLVLLVFGFLPSEIWRVMSVFIARGLDESSEVLVWVRAVASALLAGVVAKLILTPPGALGAAPFAWRLAAMSAGVLAFYLLRRSLIAAIICAEAILVGAAWWHSA